MGIKDCTRYLSSINGFGNEHLIKKERNQATIGMEEKPPAYDNLNVVEDSVGYTVPEATIGMEEKPPAYDNTNTNAVEDLIQPAKIQDQQLNQNNEEYQQQQQQQQYNGQQQQPYNGPPQQQYNGPQQQFNGPQQQQYNGPQPQQHNKMDEKKQKRLRCMAVCGIVFGSLGTISCVWLGIIYWIYFIGALCGIAAIILGAIALCRYNEENGNGSSYCLAVASLPLGLVSCIGLLILLFVLIVAGSMAASLTG